MTVDDKSLIKIQAISGLVFATFLILHLVNMAIAMFGQVAYDSFQRAMRWYYQFPVAEIVVVLAASVVHIAAALTRVIRRRRAGKNSHKKIKLPLRVRLHRYSGYFIVVVFIGHVVATRGPSLLLGKLVDMSYLSYSIAILPLFFYPYYMLLGIAGLYHLTNGVIFALRVLNVRLPKGATAPRSHLFWIWISLCGIIVLVSVLSISGNIFDLDTSRFDEWKMFASRYVPVSLLE